MLDYQQSEGELRNEVTRLRQQIAQLQEAAARSKRLENCLSSDQGRDHLIFERASDAIFIEDEDDNILDANPAASDLFGYSHAEFLTMNITHLQAAENRGQPGQVLRNEHASHGGTIFESMNMRKNGEHVPVEISLSRLGETGLTLAIVRDIRERKRAREELDESENRFKRLIENQGEGVSIVTDGKLFIFANPAANQIFGVDRLVGRSLPEFLSPEQFELIQEQDRKRHQGEKTSYEVEITQPSGAQRRLLVSASPEYNAEGRITGTFAVFRDITERKQMEQALAENEARYHSLFENSPISLWEEDMSAVQRYLESLRAQGVTDFRAYLTEHPEVVAKCVGLIRVMDVNQATLRLYQATSKEDLAERMIQKSDVRTSPEKMAINYQTFRDELIARMEGANLHEGEGIQFTCYGTPFYAYTSSVIAPGYEQTWGKVFFNVIDITARRQAEEALREREERLRLLTDNMIDTICQVDKRGRFLYLSPSIYRVFGYQPSTLIGQRALELIHPEDMQIVSQALGEARKNKRSSMRVECRFRHMNGSYIWIETSASLFYDVNGSYSWCILSSREITGRKQAEEERQRQLLRLEGLRRIDQAVSGFKDLNTILDTLLGQVIGQLKVDAADILLYDPDVQMLHYARGMGFHSTLAKHTNLALGQGYAGECVLKREKITLNPLPRRDPGDGKSLFAREGFRVYFCLPLIAKSQVKGVLEIYHRTPLAPDGDWLRYMEILAGQAAIAVDNLQMFENLQRANADLNLAYNTTLEGWSRALDLRDKETEGHSRRVMELSLRLAAAMGVQGEALIQIYRGALLHDIGKMGIPDQILLKPDSLTQEEWDIMHKHPAFAYDLLSPIPYLRSALDIPYCHHERWDGAGYPRGLKELEIPLAARIFAVVDVWDALLSDRPYRRALPREEVIEYIQNQRGKHFDPEVVDVFLHLIEVL